MFRSIRFRLTVWYALVIAVTFALSSWIVYEYVSRTLSHTLDQSLIESGQWINNQYQIKLAKGEPPQRIQQDIVDHVRFSPTKQYVEIWDSNGRMIYTRNLTPDTLVQYATINSDLGYSLQTVAFLRDFPIRLMVFHNPSSVILVGMPMGSVTEPVRHLLRIFGLLCPAVILISVFGGMALARKSFSKINQVIDTANRITADRLSDRIPEHDIDDEIGKIITTFNKMISRLDVSFQQMKQFSADASHELRTPLAVLRTQLEMALTQKSSLEEIKNIAANCLDETIRMKTIIDDLLILARSDSGRELVKREPVNLKSLIVETVDESILLASPRSIIVTLRASEDAVILGDEQKLHQMLLNLIDNAIKYNKDMGSIDIFLTRENGTGKITITDTGIGIPESDLSRIFDRFYRVDKARSRAMGGSGLGLSIVRWIVNAHGGTISVKSTLEEGSEFTMRFPIYSVS